MRILTLVDQGQIGRLFLESYLGDVVQQLKRNVNTPKTPAYELFRSDAIFSANSVAVGTDLYRPSQLLEDYRNRYGIEYVGQPKLVFHETTVLADPACFEITAQQREIRGCHALEAKIRFRDRVYMTRLTTEWKRLRYLLPVLKDFLLFASHLNLEQPEPFGTRDGINVLYTKNSDHPAESGPAVSEAGQGGQPLILVPTFGAEGNPDKNGRVYFGNNTSKIYLNLAGERHYRGFNDDTGQEDGSMCDLWHVPPMGFSANHEHIDFSAFPFDTRENGEAVTFRSLNLRHPSLNYITRVAIVGFSEENLPGTDCHFRNAEYSLSSFLKEDPAYKALQANQTSLAMASPFKLYGINPETQGEMTGFIPTRQIFGNVFARFFRIGVWESPLGPYAFPYVAEAVRSSGYRPPPAEMMGESWKWEPHQSDLAYADYMSVVVSGSQPESGGNFDMPINMEQGKPKLLRHTDFSPADGTKMREPFDMFGPQFLDNALSGNIEDSTISSRICRVFPNQQAFLAYAGLFETPPRFQLDGVFLVKGPLELPDVSLTRIRGGIILVDGPVTLGNMARGAQIGADKEGGLPLWKMQQDLTQREMVTIVALNGNPITLNGSLYCGVHLVSLAQPSGGGDSVPINFNNLKNGILLGGIAAHHFNVKKMTRRLKTPLFLLFPPTLSAPKHEFAVYCGEQPESYEHYLTLILKPHDALAVPFLET
ncbi:MAG TPA: hypothetical protein PLU72_19760, partial [Candidatus Ozemobacteraceae bacterium]|nr:hypothetical protein [Candidatus Ozemobacteraceae bacterium]